MVRDWRKSRIQVAAVVPRGRKRMSSDARCRALESGSQVDAKDPVEASQRDVLALLPELRRLQEGVGRESHSHLLFPRPAGAVLGECEVNDVVSLRDPIGDVIHVLHGAGGESCVTSVPPRAGRRSWLFSRRRRRAHLVQRRAAGSWRASSRRRRCVGRASSRYRRSRRLPPTVRSWSRGPTPGTAVAWLPCGGPRAGPPRGRR